MSNLEVMPAANRAFPFFNIAGLIGVIRLAVDKNQGRAYLSHDAAALDACLVGHSNEKAKGVTSYVDLVT